MCRWRIGSDAVLNGIAKISLSERKYLHKDLKLREPDCGCICIYAKALGRIPDMFKEQQGGLHGWSRMNKD